jgi:hypothetical protein
MMRKRARAGERRQRDDYERQVPFHASSGRT